MQRQIVAKLVDELRNATPSNWQQEGGYKQYIFKQFCEACAGGIAAAPSGDELRREVREFMKDDRHSLEAIEETLQDVSQAWNEWIYAVQNWPNHSK